MPENAIVPGPPLNQAWFWAHYMESEDWFGPYATRDIAAHHAKQAARSDPDHVDMIGCATALGMCFTRADVDLRGLGEEAIQRCQNWIEDSAIGEEADDWPAAWLSTAEENELDGRLAAVVHAFLEEHRALPTPFYQMIPGTSVWQNFPDPEDE